MWWSVWERSSTYSKFVHLSILVGTIKKMFNLHGQISISIIGRKYINLTYYIVLILLMLEADYLTI